ncbi:MAG: (d)CMP kinase [Candidatus Moeniiplasma glomeromycotorum]|nr:(d)CMP kinase [Candidatus Moeniiplasma glomeromycotorum]MCE8168240.1 (d)CMP kinase [Candidatus Moeniiplasma glomeromycotorum]
MVKINIAMDGPGGAGKTTIARLLAEKLNFQFLDSGLLYRHFATFYQKNNASRNEIEKLLPAWKNWLNGNQFQIVAELEKVREQLQTPEISKLASQLSVQPELRKIASNFQRKLTENKGWVVVGRDITSAVLPQAEIKIFLTASLAERAKRRNKQLSSNSEAIQQELQARDERDRNRSLTPLLKTADSWELDTTHLSPTQSLEKILTYLHSQGY